MEGHNLKLQSLVRAQPMHSADINLLKLMVEMLVLQCEDPTLLKRVENTSLELIIATLDAIIEAMQGPAPANQVTACLPPPALLHDPLPLNVDPFALSLGREQIYVAKSDALIAIKNLIPSPFTEKGRKLISRRLRMLCKSRAVLFLSAALEGRRDKVRPRLPRRVAIRGPARLCCGALERADSSRLRCNPVF